MQKPKLLCVVGPTSSGKTALSIHLARLYGGEVVSADARQVYRGLDLGTGKVTLEERAGVPHHLLDVADPKTAYTASDYLRDGRTVLDDILTRGHVPIIAGGTGFYIDILLGRASVAEVAPNEALRAELETLPLFELHAQLHTLDTEAYARVDLKNPRRVIRAIEIARARRETDHTVKKSSSHTPRHHSELYQTLWIGLKVDREVLKEKIRTRLIERLNAGMVEEVKRLHAEGLSFERMHTLGLEYRALSEHLQGKRGYDEMIDELSRDIYRYAKRQMTWFKKNKDIKWFSPQDYDAIVERCDAFLKKS